MQNKKKARAEGRGDSGSVAIKVLDSAGSQHQAAPQEMDLEEVVIGAVMLEGDSEYCHKILEILKGKHFHSVRHGIIFDTILAMVAVAEPVDILTVSNRLKVEGKLERCGGAAYIAGMTGRVSSAQNAQHHAGIVLERYLQRELIRLLRGALASAGALVDPFALMEDIVAGINNLSKGIVRDESKEIEELFDDRMELIRKRVNEEWTPNNNAVLSHFTALDRLTGGFKPGELIILAARPGMGKTTFALGVATQVATLPNPKDRIPTAFFSLEMTNERLVEKMMSAVGKVDLQHISNFKITRREYEQLEVNTGHIPTSPMWFDDGTASTLAEISLKVRKLVRENGVKFIVIDYLQLMHGDPNRRSERREQEVAAISRGLKLLAKDQGITILALSQLSREVERRGGVRRPVLADLRESGAIEQDADLVMFLYRDAYYQQNADFGGLLADDEDDVENERGGGEDDQGRTELILAKHRHGPTGTVHFQFQPRYSRFREV